MKIDEFLQATIHTHVQCGWNVAEASDAPISDLFSHFLEV